MVYEAKHEGEGGGGRMVEGKGWGRVTGTGGTDEGKKRGSPRVAIRFFVWGGIEMCQCDFS